MAVWYEKSRFYHIYPFGLCHVPKSLDSFLSSSSPVCGFSTLNEFVPYIKDLGLNALYIGPLFESSTHGYDTKDYRKVDPRLGSNQDFKDFVSLCHQSGIRVVVDGVFNHTGRDFFAFRDLLENKWDSPYKDWYRNVNFSQTSPLGDPFSYEAWQGHYILPVLNLSNPEVKKYLYETVSFWIHSFDIDGIRLDCANILDFDFMKGLRSFCDGQKEDFWLMGEVIHGIYSRYANPEMLHSVTNYELHKALYSGHNDYNCFEIAHTVKRQVWETSPGLCLYNFVDNHDEDRLASKLHNPAHLFTVYAMLFTLPGIPSIYYGSEWGIPGRRTRESDEALRPSFSAADARANASPLTDYIRTLADIHASHPAFHHGSYQEILLTNRQYAYLREGGGERTLCAFHIDTQADSLSLPSFDQGDEALDLLTNESFPVTDGRFSVPMGPCQARIFIQTRKGA